MSHGSPTLPEPRENVFILNRDELTALLEQAAARGASIALQCQQPRETFLNAAAAEYVYGRPGKIEAWRQLRLVYPELDASSTGTGAARHWTREALDAFLDKHPQFRRRAQKAA